MLFRSVEMLVEAMGVTLVMEIINSNYIIYAVCKTHQILPI